MVSGRTTGLSAEQCTAKAKGTQQRCQRLVMGGGVCIVHGGRARQVNAAREARVVAALAQASGGVTEARDPGEALVSAAVDADQIVQKLKRSLDAGEEIKPSELRALGDWLDRTGRLAKTVLDARVDERRVRVTEAQHRELLAILTAVIRQLGHDPDDPEVIEVVRSCSAAIGAGGRRPGLAAVRAVVVVPADEVTATDD